eukprot:5201029-Pleurochrysis_carterae.AAC.2
MDQRFNDATVDCAIAFPSMLAACFRRATTPSHVAVPEAAARPSPSARSKSISAPIATRTTR